MISNEEIAGVPPAASAPVASPEPAAGAPAAETPRALTSDESEAQATLAAALAVLTNADADVGARDAAVAAVVDLLVPSREELARLDSLEQLTHEEVLAEHNAKRRHRRLEGEFATARAALEEATEKQQAAATAAALAKIGAHDAELKALDADFIAAARACRAQLAAKRAVIWERLAEANELQRSLTGTTFFSAFGALSGVPDLNPAVTPCALSAAVLTLDRLEVISRERRAEVPGYSKAYDRLLAETA